MLHRLPTFKGGVHLPGHKHLTRDKPVRRARAPRIAVLLMLQHSGAECRPLVGPGDLVWLGQKVGDSDQLISAPIHSPVSGRVVAVEPRLHPAMGREVTAVIVESDGKDQVHESVRPAPDPGSALPEQIIRAVREAGIVGLGGAGFPTHVKLGSSADRPRDLFILNGTECEPFLTGDLRLMIEEPFRILRGAVLLMKAAGIERGVVAIDRNKPEAIKTMRREVARFPDIEVVVVAARYPHGGEKQLIEAITGRQAPPPPGLPSDVGVLVNNVQTAFATSKAVEDGMPLVERVLTVSGRVRDPANLLVRIGTPFEDVIEECGGFEDQVAKVLMGGPMTGLSQPTLCAPVVKGTSGLIALAEEDTLFGESSKCVRCGRCVDVCPVRILPVWIAAYADRGDFGQARKLHAITCIECGSCSYICPARLPLLDSIKLAKIEIAKHPAGR